MPNFVTRIGKPDGLPQGSITSAIDPTNLTPLLLSRRPASTGHRRPVSELYTNVSSHTCRLELHVSMLIHPVIHVSHPRSPTSLFNVNWTPSFTSPCSEQPREILFPFKDNRPHPIPECIDMPGSTDDILTSPDHSASPELSDKRGILSRRRSQRYRDVCLGAPEG
jgi:hypothetical protein